MARRIFRRRFLKNSAAAPAETGGLSLPRSAQVQGTGKIKIGLIGCGGRGRGAVVDTFTAAEQAGVEVELTAVGDAFGTNAEGALEGLKAQFEDRIAVTPETTFSGLECYKDVIAASDLILLCETPAFRPISLRAAIEAGKHVFCEKPVAVDAPGIKSVLETTEMAKEKNLNLVSGLCWRYDLNVKDMMQRVMDGAIGDIISSCLTYVTGRLWTRPAQEGDTEMMAQVRNWYNFSWLSGDYNVEQHIHTLDIALWAMHDEAPDCAFGLGGRMQRVDQPDYGNIYDSMAVAYEYPNGVTHYSYCRQQDGCWNRDEAIFAGTKGTAVMLGDAVIKDYQGNVIYQQEKQTSDLYTLEHLALYEAIKSGEPINNGTYMARSTMMAILGREACYTGQRLTWEEALEGEAMRPAAYNWESDPPAMPDENGRYLIPVPGEGMQYHQIVR